MRTPSSSEGATQLRVEAPLPQAGTPPQGSPRPQAKPRDGSPTSVLRCASASSATSSDADASPGRATGGALALPGAAGPHNAGQAAVAFQRSSCRVARCAPGFRLRLEDVPAPRRNSALEEALAVGSLLVLFGLAWLMPWLLLYALVQALCFASRPAALFLALFAGAAVLPAGQFSARVRGSRLWDAWRRHFRLRAVTPPLPFLGAGRRVLCCQFPHSVFPMGFLLGAPLAGLPESGLPPLRGAVATILLRLPLLKHMLAALGSFPADREALLSVLRTTSVALAPEGVAGTWCATRKREAVYLKKRMGFVRVAIQAGADLVPVYHLGCSQLLDFWGSEALSRRCRVCCGFFFGCWGLPLPRRHPIITLVGAPVPVVQCDVPSDAQVAEVHARFVAALIALFDAHKHLMGPAWVKRTLEIV